MTFDERMKVRARREDCPVPEGFEDRLHARVEACLSETEKEEIVVKKRIVGTVLLAAALCGVLCVGAFALSPTLQEAMAAALGSFFPYSQTVDGAVAADQGIEIRAVSVLMDEEDGTAYLEVTDRTGERLGENSRLVGDYTLRPLAYDPDTGVALYRVPLRRAYNEMTRGNTETLELHFKTLYPNVVELPYESVTSIMADGSPYSWWRGETSIPAQLYHNAAVLESLSLTEEEIDGSSAYNGDPVLAPEQTPMDLGSEYFSLSSLGFDDRGVLHVQLKLAEGITLTHCSDIEIDILPGQLFADYGLSDGLSYRRVLFGEGRYLDVAFKEVDQTVAARLPDSTIYGELCTATDIKGTWALSIPYAPLPRQTVELNQPFCWEGIDLVGADLSAMSFRLTYTGGDTHSIYMGGQPLHLFCKDGSVLKLSFGDRTLLYRNGAGEEATNEALAYEQKFQGADGWQYFAERDDWNYPRAVAPEDVAGFSWGQWYVPLDGSGSGYWLSEVPVATE